MHYVLCQVWSVNEGTIEFGDFSIQRYNELASPTSTPGTTPTSTPRTSALRPNNGLMLLAAWREMLCANCEMLANLENRRLVSQLLANFFPVRVWVFPLQ
jgi:hypothetical protein